ncbi:MAG: hypothetical protein P4L92_13220 [Rudaea sp.]|nr:hypothetical protein [Rudaea sp.]
MKKSTGSDSAWGRIRAGRSARAFRDPGVQFAWALLVLVPALTLAQTPAISQLQYSADSGANIVGAGQYAARQDYVIDNLGAGSRSRVQIPGLPERVNLRDFQIDGNGDLLFALDVGVTLNGIYFDPADVIRYSAGSFSKAFDAAAAGVPRGVHCDGVARSGTSGALLLSFDKTFAVGGITIRPADVIAVSAGSFGAKVLDANALGLSAALNVDAVDALRTTTDLLVAFDTGGTAGSVTFMHEDILQLHLANGSWTKRYSLATFSDRWGTVHLDGLAATNDTIFNDGFE